MAPSLRSLPPPSKKRKVAPKAGSETLVHIQNLEAQIAQAVEKHGSLNPLADLLECARATNDTESMSKVLYALYRSFVVIITAGKLSPGGDDAVKVVRGWIWEQLNGYVNLLSGLLTDVDKYLRVSLSSLLR